MRIKVLEPTGIRHGGDVYTFNDICTVPDDEGQHFVTMGWAEDLDGNVATGDRNAMHGKVLEVQNGHIGLTSEVGGHG